MKISAAEVAGVAKLARLKLDDGMSEMLTVQMNEILDYMDKLGELDTSGVPATNHALELTGAMRPDQTKPSLERDLALANAPESNGQCFVVPRVL